MRAFEARERHPRVVAAALGMLTSTVLTVILWWGRMPTGWGLVIALVLWLVFASVFAAVTSKQIERFGPVFPSGRSRETRVTIRRAVRRGEPVTDRDLAYGVDFHADVVLARPCHPVAVAVTGVVCLMAGVGFMLFVEGWDKSAGPLLLVLAGALMLVTAPAELSLRRGAVAAQRQAAAVLYAKHERPMS
ncbi:hypothetical protein EV193_115124 [Herbihabitans rhizosphaerae]|uniref:Uncharacterized protein n=1 Tax=Herbihabitans rhizosphaerae TaxID=1872711 RepID=A0A4Q7KD25_9PSEU|nr:hypothetical protein [Herbihabitans rhizosphaerae]RZS31245.1 hypothetical protein EV193_115124 [Herbihabitans rhizosphaerae]